MPVYYTTGNLATNRQQLLEIIRDEPNNIGSILNTCEVVSLIKMPTCPVCQQQLSHAKIPVHLRFCAASTGRQPAEESILEYFNERLAHVEQQLDAYVALTEGSSTAPVAQKKRPSSSETF